VIEGGRTGSCRSYILGRLPSSLCDRNDVSNSVHLERSVLETDAAAMEELELWLQQQTRGASLKKPKKVSKKLLCPYSQSMSLEQFKPHKHPKNRRKQASLPALNKDLSKEEMAAKTVALPYASSYLLVEESLRIITEWSPQSRDLNNSSVSQAKISSLIKRFPRFCEGLNFNENSGSYKLRSDLWLVRIIEESYDAVSCECSKHVSAVRTRQRYNLDLGALDSFPQSVKRFVAQKYRSVITVCSVPRLIFGSSVLSILPQICMEILLALDRVAVLSEKVCMHRQVDEATVCDSGRVFMFSAFLSEELDVDRLAAYLQVRDIAQEIAGFHFKDVIAHMQRPIPLSPDSDCSPTRPALRDEPDEVDILDVSKICPLKLPFHLRVMKDASMPEAPLLAIDLRAVSLVCQRVAPNCSATSRKYLWNKILFWASTLIKRKSSIFRILEYLREDGVALSECQFEGTLLDGLRVLPAHVVIWAVCTEFAYYKGDQQLSIAEALHGDGPKEAATSDQGLAMLNRLYDNNRALVEGLEAEISQAELHFSQCRAKILDLEKQKRKIERKWKEFQPDLHLRGAQAAAAEENKGYDLTELSQIKMTLIEAEEERYLPQCMLVLSLFSGQAQSLSSRD
jgi:hypothetical protein